MARKRTDIKRGSELGDLTMGSQLLGGTVHSISAMRGGVSLKTVRASLLSDKILEVHDYEIKVIGGRLRNITHVGNPEPVRECDASYGVLREVMEYAEVLRA